MEAYSCGLSIWMTLRRSEREVAISFQRRLTRKRDTGTSQELCTFLNISRISSSGRLSTTQGSSRAFGGWYSGVVAFLEERLQHFFVHSVRLRLSETAYRSFGGGIRTIVEETKIWSIEINLAPNRDHASARISVGWPLRRSCL